ncbi:hypothetical protein [Parabacteroides faecis]|uniref:hypothetical protein n=1 Tax=Parabacteroides faecis TaxID=1217282 RepID=UPI0035206ACF
MRQVTTPQLKKIHTLLGQLGLMDSKPEIVNSFTDGRTESSREMMLSEAKALIEWLMGTQERTSIIRRIWHLAYEMEIIIPGDQNEKAMNVAKLDTFCKERGTVKKAISAQSLKEIKRTAKQFEAMYNKHKEKLEIRLKIQALEGYLQIFIKHEEYEKAVGAKELIDELKKEIAPKRKRAAKTV